MICQDIQQQLYPFLDGELDDALRDAFRHHLDGCPSCRTLAEEIGQFENQLRTTLPDEPVPSGIWARIQADLEPGVATGAAVEKTSRVTAWKWAAAVAAVLVLAFGMTRVKPLFAPESLQARLLSVPVDDLHTFMASRRALDVASTAPQHVRQWFQEKVDFPPPELPVRVGTAHLVGGRLCHFLDRRVASYMYDADGHYLSLYVMPRQGLSPPAGADVALESLRATLHEVHGYTHIIWSRMDLLYSLVSDLPREQLVDMARAVVREG